MYFQYISFLLLVISSDMRPAAPSQDSGRNDKLYILLSDANCRFFYNKTFNLTSKNLFLETCNEENVIPNTFAVANKPQDDITDEWLDTGTEASKGFMRAAINSNNVKIRSLCETRDIHVEALCDFTNDEEIKEEIFLRIAAKRIIFAEAAAKVKAERLKWLRTKAKSQAGKKEEEKDEIV